MSVLNIAEILAEKTLSVHQGFLPGPIGALEAIVTSNTNSMITGEKRVGIICHPHPLYQGTMRNKVVSIIAKAMHNQGMPTIRFNYRGVEKSAGKYDNTIGETADLLAIVNQVHQDFPNAKLWLAGFSFGAYIASKAAAKLDSQHIVEQLITVAPAVNKVDFTDIGNISCRWSTIIGTADEIVPYADVVAWHDSLRANKELIAVQDCSHFFHGKLSELMRVIPICK